MNTVKSSIFAFVIFYFLATYRRSFKANIGQMISLDLIRKNLPFLTAFLIPLISFALYKVYPYINPLRLDLRLTNRHGGELVASVLKAHGVKYVFTLIGGHISPIVVAAKKEGIRVIDVRSECTTVFAADAVSRLSGVPGVAVVTAGPGPMKNAQMAQSPLVLIGGAAATLLKGRGSLQDVEQIAVLRSIAKYHASARNVREIVPILKRAFHEASSGVPGPVFVEIPLDCLYCYGEVAAVAGLTQCVDKKDVNEEQKKRVMVPYEFENRESTFDPKVIEKYLETRTATQPIYIDSTKKKLPFIVDTYLRYNMRYLFAGAFSRKWNFNPVPVQSQEPKLKDVYQTVKFIMESQKPCIIISSQALLCADKAEAIAKAVEKLQIPVFLSSMARGLLGRDHKLYIKQGRTAALRQSDLIIVCGTMVDFRLDYGRVFNRKAKIIAINRSYNDLRLNTDLFWKPTLTMQCDPGLALLAMAKSIKKSASYEKRVSSHFEEWCSGLKKLEVVREQQNAEKAKAPSYPRPALNMIKNVKTVLNPLAVCLGIEKYMDENSIIIVDGGDFAASAAYICRPRGPLKWMDPGPFGTLGVGAGFALGAKLVNPDAEIWLIWGDGSSGYSIAEVDTMRRFGVGVICVIGNDACWSQIEREQIPKLGDNTACMLSYCDYDVICKGYGGGGESVHEQKELMKEGDNPFIRAKKYVKEHNAPYVINAHIGCSDFRAGSISV